MPVDKDLSLLLEHYLTNSCSAEEFNELFSLIEKEDNKAELLLLLKIHWEADSSGEAGTDDRWELMYQRIRQGKQAAPSLVKHPGISLYRRVAVAASVCLTIGAGVLFFLNKKARKEEIVQHSGPVASGQLAPGGNKATLTLANGKKVILDDRANGTILSQAGIRITKKADGKLVYHLEGLNAAAEQKSLFNTIETPRGGQYEITMPDGTRIWLNAMSSLKYPLVFDKDQRRVFLRGEAYFEVAKAGPIKERGGRSNGVPNQDVGGSTRGSWPFVVKTADQEVEVLGTHFNVNAYEDENATRTTLLEGAVNVREEKTGSMRPLKPGQQMLLKAGKMQVQQVDTELTVAWKNGTFNFNRETLESIMRQISRWYDVEVEYKDESVKNQLLSGSVSRFENAGELIQVLSLTKLVHFKIEGRRIIVMK